MADASSMAGIALLSKMINFSKFSKFEDASGFTLIEALVAIVILLIVLLGVFSVFTYAVIYNSGNNTRSQALSVLQREVELVRSYKFTPVITDSDLTGGTKAAKYVTAADGSSYKVDVIVDDDPNTAGVQTDATKTLKEVTISVAPANQVAGWQTAIGSQIVLRRVRGN
jgi:prepilin-type N-terminal cleavage/methylation domain-containing protein